METKAPRAIRRIRSRMAAMTVKQAIRDRVRVFNKHVTNKLLIHISGKSFGHFAILGHTGRKSGKLYRIPIIAEPTERGFVIALTYGKKVDWCANVLAKGDCTLAWKNKEYVLEKPEFVDPEIGLRAFVAAPRTRSAVSFTGERPQPFARPWQCIQPPEPRQAFDESNDPLDVFNQTVDSQTDLFSRCALQECLVCAGCA